MPFGSGYEAGSVSKLRRAETSVTGPTSQSDAFWEAYMTCAGFYNIKSSFLTISERSF